MLAALIVLPNVLLAQGTSGSGTYGGTIPTTVAITNTSNGTLAGTLGSFGTLTIGSSSALNTPTPLVLRLRSNTQYRLSADVTANTGLTDGPAGRETTTAQGVKTGDIGFGITAAIDKSGASVVGGGSSPNRNDTIATGYDVHGGWPTLSDGHTPAFSKTLHDIFNNTQILSGDRISASGDNSSDDNYLVITVGIAMLPQYFTAAPFSGTVTFTITAGDGGDGN